MLDVDPQSDYRDETAQLVQDLQAELTKAQRAGRDLQRTLTEVLGDRTALQVELEARVAELREQRDRAERAHGRARDQLAASRKLADELRSRLKTVANERDAAQAAGKRSDDLTEEVIQELHAKDRELEIRSQQLKEMTEDRNTFRRLLADLREAATKLAQM
jgi:Skp family chaperone for outer membrane proteins